MRSLLALSSCLLCMACAGSAPPPRASEQIQQIVDVAPSPGPTAKKSARALATVRSEPDCPTCTKEELDQRRRWAAEREKMLNCSRVPNALIGLSQYDLRERCGPWYKTNITTTPRGTFEQLIYGTSSYTVMYVYVDNGTVTTVQSR